MQSIKLWCLPRWQLLNLENMNIFVQIIFCGGRLLCILLDVLQRLWPLVNWSLPIAKDYFQSLLHRAFRLISQTVLLTQWFLLPPPWGHGQVCQYFWFSQFSGAGISWRHLVGRARVLQFTEQHYPPPLRQRILWPKMSIVTRMRNFVLSYHYLIRNYHCSPLLVVKMTESWSFLV